MLLKKCLDESEKGDTYDTIERQLDAETNKKYTRVLEEMKSRMIGNTKVCVI